MSQRERDIQRRDARKAATYGAWAIGVDLRGRHEHHAKGAANPRYVDGRGRGTIAKRRIAALANGWCPRCFHQPSALPKRQCVGCLAVGRVKAKAAYARRCEARQRLRPMAPPTPAPIAGYMPPAGSIAWSLLGRIVPSRYGDAHA